jgi:hypothetical protein
MRVLSPCLGVHFNWLDIWNPWGYMVELATYKH